MLPSDRRPFRSGAHHFIHVQVTATTVLQVQEHRGVWSDVYLLEVVKDTGMQFSMFR